MPAKRIIPCLDVKNGKVVKGINFFGIREVGDPVECAIEYDRQGADEIVFLDITATHEGRGIMLDVVKKTAEKVFVPLTVGGGIRTAEDFRELLLAGADKVSVNSAAVKRPELISEAALKYGSQCVVLAVDAKKTDSRKYNVYVNGGRIDTGIDLLEWVRQGEKLGAGEILLTSMDKDGTKDGYDLEMLDSVCKTVNIPVIASGGCGTIGHFARLFEETDADAALAASIFHYGDLTVEEVKEVLHRRKIPVRII